MLCTQIISTEYPTLSAHETVADIQSLNLKTQESIFPVLKEGEYVGILALEEIKSLSQDTLISTLTPKALFVHGDEHFLSAMKVMTLTGLPILPIIDRQNQYQGVVTRISLLHALGILMDIEHSTGALLSLQMAKTAFSFTELARLVESNDANITQMNSYLDAQSDKFIVTIRLDKKDISDIVSTLQRYEYQVVYFWGDELYENELKRNYDALMNYLSI